MRRSRLLTPLFALTLAPAITLPLTACGSSSTTEATPSATVETTTFASSLGIDLSASGWTKTSSGLWYRTVTAAPATAAVVVAAGSHLSVQYTGWLADGTQFDAGMLTYVVGTGYVVPGFDQGVAGMRVGETRRLLIPPSLGYGAAGNGTKIPGNAVLVFDITVLSAT